MPAEALPAGLPPGDIVTSFRRIPRHVEIVEAEVDRIGLRARTVSCVAGIGDVDCEFAFDHLLHEGGPTINPGAAHPVAHR